MKRGTRMLLPVLVINEMQCNASRQERGCALRTFPERTSPLKKGFNMTRRDRRDGRLIYPQKSRRSN